MYHRSKISRLRPLAAFRNVNLIVLSGKSIHLSDNNDLKYTLRNFNQLFMVIMYMLKELIYRESNN